MKQKPFAAATERNKHAILGVLREEFRDSTSVLEIGSGTGQHAVHFGKELSHLRWQTSDIRDNHEAITAWIDDASLANVLAPMALDVLVDDVPEQRFDAVFSANTAHIMGFDAVEKMFALVSNVLVDRGLFALYGPFRLAGQFNTASNEQFHASLQQQDSAMGIRDLEALDELAAKGGLERQRLYAMPANNHVAIWRKKEGAGP